MVKWVVVVGWGGGGFTGWLGFKRRTGKSQGEDARQERLAVRVAGSTDRVVMVVVVGVGGWGRRGRPEVESYAARCRV